MAVEALQNRRLQHFTSDHGCATWRRLLARGVPEKISLFEVNTILTRPTQTREHLHPYLFVSFSLKPTVRFIHNRGFSYQWMNLQFIQQLKDSS